MKCHINAAVHSLDVELTQLDTGWTFPPWFEKVEIEQVAFWLELLNVIFKIM